MNFSSWAKQLLPGSLIVLALMFAVVVSPAGSILAQEDNPLTERERVVAGVYENVSPSVVAITVDELVGQTYIGVSTGSGFVIDEEGYIITNFHVVDGVDTARGDRIVVNFIDGTLVRADFIGGDPDADIAVLRVDVDPELLFPVTFADSSNLVIGQTALAIGSPFGQRWTLTSGIISALDRVIEGLDNFSTGAVIQTDTPINPGNSGGPLLNIRGEVIGVNAQIISEERANSGVGFAIPSNLVQRVATQLIENGEVQYSYLGIRGDDIRLDYIEQLDLPPNLRGVIVTLVRGGEPAAMGGLQTDDIILEINEREIDGFGMLLSYLASDTTPGDTITMTVLRNGEIIDLDVTLGSR